jgi:hypothetical protein
MAWCFVKRRDNFTFFTFYKFRSGLFLHVAIGSSKYESEVSYLLPVSKFLRRWLFILRFGDVGA